MSKINNLVPYIDLMLNKVIPDLIAKYKIEAPSCPYSRDLADDALIGLCAAMLDLYLTQIIPTSLDREGNVMAITKSEIMDNLIRNHGDDYKYHYYLDRLLDYTESNGCEWKWSTLLFAIQELTPGAPQYQSPAVFLAAEIRIHIQNSVKNF